MEQAWARLRALHERAAEPRTLFARDKDRFSRFSASCGELLLDYSKTQITEEILDQLLRLAEAADVAGKRRAMFAGEKINRSEDRAVLHIALRSPAASLEMPGGGDVMPEIRAALETLYGFAEQVRSGLLSGSDGHPFTDIVNIGIGGSDLGPLMVTAALAPYHDGPRLHFVSNIDGAHLGDTLKWLNPRRTLFIVASKTFTTSETLTNARSARQWIAESLGEAAVAAHFAAVSTALEQTAAFGIPADRVFGFWDWVGGRYSVFSAVGLAVMLAIGPARFRQFLAGAAEMDAHFLSSPPERNLPLLLGLIGVWHRNICGYPARAILPYDQRLARFPAYLQQLDMESNGKHVTRDGAPVARATGPLVWGEPGTNGQHAFYQLLHQGTDIIPCEFLIAARGHEPELSGHHELLIANCLAQSQALLEGRTLEQAGGNPHREFAGNRPSITLAYPLLDPAMLGKLIALYEHRVFTEAAIWNINAFDQWGVELGKELAKKLIPAVRGEQAAEGDSSTLGLLNYLRSQQSGL